MARKRLSPPKQPAARRRTVYPVRPASRSTTPIILGLAAVFVLVLFVVIATQERQPRRQPVVAPAVAPTPSGGADSQAAATQAAYRRLVAIEEYARSHPQDTDGIIARYRALARETGIADVAATARQRIAELERTLQEQRVAALMERLERSAEQLAAGGDLAGAARLMTGYAGEFAAETAAVRARLGEVYRQRAAAARQPGRPLPAPVPTLPDAELTKVAVTAAGHLIEWRLAEVKRALPETGAEAVATPVNELLKAATALLRTFASQRGQTLFMRFSDGRTRRIEVVDVQGTQVRAREVPLRQGVAIKVPHDFSLADVALAEAKARLPKASGVGVQLLFGLCAVSDGDVDQAKVLFGQVGGPLAAALTAELAAVQKRRAEKAAKAAFAKILEAAGLPADKSLAELRVLAADLHLPRDMAATVAGVVQDFRAAHGGTDLAAKAEPLLTALLEQGATTEALPVTRDLVLWLSAGGGVVKDADDGVERWADYRSGKLQAVQEHASYRPTWVRDAVAGRPGIDFDGLSDFLEIAPNPAMNQGGPYSEKTLLVVAIPERTAGKPQVLFAQGDAQRGLNAFIEDRLFYGSVWDLEQSGRKRSWGPFYVGHNIRRNNAYCLSTVYSFPRRRLEVYLNGRLRTAYQEVHNDSGAMGRLYGNDDVIAIGRCSDRTYLLNRPGRRGANFGGTILDIVYYNRALPASDVRALENYLSRKYQFELSD